MAWPNINLPDKYKKKKTAEDYLDELPELKPEGKLKPSLATPELVEAVTQSDPTNTGLAATDLIKAEPNEIAAEFLEKAEREKERKKDVISSLLSTPPPNIAGAPPVEDSKTPLPGIKNKEIQAFLDSLEPEEQAVVPLARKANRKYPDVPVSLLMSLMRQESGFNPLARSEADAQGLTQFIPSTAEAYNVEYGDSPRAKQSQVTGAAKLLTDEGFAEDPYGALTSYTGGYSDEEYNDPVYQGAKDYAPLDKLKRGDVVEVSPNNRTVKVKSDARGMVKWAERVEGVKEGTQKQQRWADKYSLGYTQPWCANFVSVGLARRGIKPPPNPNYVPSYEHEWDGGKNVGSDIRKAKPGDLLAFSGEHIGVYIGNGEMISGNSSDAVSRTPATHSYPLTAILRPKYSGKSVELPITEATPNWGTSTTGGSYSSPASSDSSTSSANELLTAATQSPSEAPEPRSKDNLEFVLDFLDEPIPTVSDPTANLKRKKDSLLRLALGR